ncbi:hypothetical protein A8C32_19155 [Flavivirga aquatica]|uniref:Lipoprotein n=1 Tax=Flavivirga aquatica TaxID=1849968 RepID=A0A1E5T448_9FLAO|nr:hypothetical protein [Flavivirga aquatica]OEK06150.1 hypothetical protein A8C32_19155 [Flavivirga aquatica]
MKKLFALCLILTLFTSCINDDDNITQNSHVDILPIESVDIPSEFELGETYPITVSYLRPSTCHIILEDFAYAKENNQRTIAPKTLIINEDNCEALENELIEKSFNFTVTSNSSYIFRFWQGRDADGESQYLIVEVPVND